jgi:hypothetical protein
MDAQNGFPALCWVGCEDLAGKMLYVLCTLLDPTCIQSVSSFNSHDWCRGSLVSNIQAYPRVSAVGSVCPSSDCRVQSGYPSHQDNGTTESEANRPGGGMPQAFEQLVYHIKLYDNTLSSSMLIA